MIVVVVDASILIDLLKIELVDEFFKLNFVFHTTDLIMGEIEEPNIEILNKYIKNQKLNVMNFSFEDISEIHQLGLKFPFLSIPDCSCIKACQKKNAILLTGEKKLKKICEEKGIETHGILWIFKNFLDQEIMRPDPAKQNLAELSNLNPRLPEEEIRKFISEI